MMMIGKSLAIGLDAGALRDRGFLSAMIGHSQLGKGFRAFRHANFFPVRQSGHQPPQAISPWLLRGDSKIAHFGAAVAPFFNVSRRKRYSAARASVD
jgi:hypothetical protein